MAGRAMHPIVERFATTSDPFFHLLADAHLSEDPMVRAMGMCRDAIGQARPMDEALAAARAVPLDHPDPALTMLFLGVWGSATAKAGNREELSGIVNRLRAMDRSAVPPEVAISPEMLAGILARVRGDIAGHERCLLSVMDRIGPDSPRHTSFVLELAMLLAGLGRMSERSEELDALRADETFHVRWLLPAHWLMQYAETGQAAAAEEQVRQLADAPWEALTFLEGQLRNARALSALIAGRWAAGAPAPASPVTSGWSAVVDHLLLRRPVEALELARAEAAGASDFALYEPTFRGFNLIRAELSAGNGAAAGRLLHLRHERGVHHPLHPLFLARVERLAGRSNAASHHFAQARAAAERYAAQGRLDLELRAACELSPSALLELAGDPPRPHPAPRGPDPSGAAAEPAGTARLVGRSAAIRAVRETVQRYAPLDTAVLVTGETGTGKELAARALHESGPRSDDPFLAVNCGGIAEGLLESELFGHAKGAFTGATKARRGLFETAATGTLFLDEIGEVTPRLQVVLLRALETGEIRPVGSSRSRQARCRVVAATNADLDSRVAAGTFRADLLYRLRRLEVVLPPLRDRAEDCAVLAAHFLARGRADGQPPALAADLTAELARRPWPGNVRELRNVVERMRVLNSDAPRYDLAALERAAPSATLPDAATANAPAASALPSPPPPTPRVLVRGRSAWRRRERLAELFRLHRRLSRSEVMRLLEISHGTAQRDLETLAAEGLIAKVTPSASTRTHYYRLADSVTFSPKR